MKKPKFIVPALAVPAIAAPLVATAAVPENLAGTRPNIIFILVDDMGWGDLECNWDFAKSQKYKNGSRQNSFKTPELNKMAKEGILLARHYSACPVSAPARASLITGVHQGHARQVRDNTFDTPIENSHTLATVMKGAGYSTAIIGKWGLGGVGNGSTGGTAWARPRERGFDYFYGIFDHQAGHFHYPALSNRFIWENETDVTAKVRASGNAYTTDLFTAKAKDWITQQAKAKKPFFLFLSHPAPHGSLRVPNAAYPAGGGLKGGVQWKNDSVNTASMGGQPDTYIHPDNEKIKNDAGRRHATMIRRIDDSIGDLRKLLSDLKISDNTLIVFTSDNGPHDEPGNDAAKSFFPSGSPRQDPSYFKSYGMMDGIKRDCWEGGMREPCVVLWPKKIVPAKKPITTPTQFQDWMATFADLAAVEVPARSDGVSMLPIFAGKEREIPSQIYVEYSYTGAPNATPKYKDFAAKHVGTTRRNQIVVFVQDSAGTWFKGICKGCDASTGFANAQFEIYDTLKDPQELTNLAGTAKKFDAMQTQMREKVLRSRRPWDGDRSETGRFDFSEKKFLEQTAVPALKKFGKEQGLAFEIFKPKKAFPWVPDFRQTHLTATESGTTDLGNAPKFAKGGNIGVHCEGFITVPETGEYVFSLKTNAAAGTKAFVHLHDMQLIDADFLYKSGDEADSFMNVGTKKSRGEKKVFLEKGAHAIRIDYVTTAGSNAKLQLFWTLPNGQKEEVPASALTH